MTVAQTIYTTHSAGCLPEDLGTGIRIVEPIPETNHSRIRNKFWTKEPGFSPLLLGMGANTLAFFPTRDAVISEGPTELIMLGTLLREVIGQDEIGFQLVPGSANARPSHIGGLDLQAPQMAWLVDGDKGGRDLTKKITDNDIPANRVVPIDGDPESGLVIEDLIAPTVYVQALNEEIARRADGEVPKIDQSDLGIRNRPASVKAWCEGHDIAEPDKIAVAHHVVKARSTETLVDPNQIEVVRQLHTDLLEALARTD